MKTERWRWPGGILLFLLSGIAAGGGAESATLKVMSFNIRCLTAEADARDLWWFRRDEVAALLRRHEPDVAGLQEVYRSQARDLAVRLPGYEWYGMPRDDGRRRGEMCAIFFRPERLELKNKGTFWLSRTPEEPGSISWGAACRRVVSWTCFLDRRTGKEFFLFNTHFDHMSRLAREESAKLLLERIPGIAAGAPVIITGDFNADPASLPYETITAVFADARLKTVTSPVGPEGTDRPFLPGTRPQKRIDYIFVLPGINVQTYATLEDTYGRDRRPSDHLPIKATLLLP